MGPRSELFAALIGCEGSLRVRSHTGVGPRGYVLTGRQLPLLGAVGGGPREIPDPSNSPAHLSNHLRPTCAGGSYLFGSATLEDFVPLGRLGSLWGRRGLDKVLDEAQDQLG